MTCKEHFKNKELFLELINKLETRGYIIDELDKISRVLISKLNGCFKELLQKYNITTNITSETINTHAIECNGEWVYIAWNNELFDFDKAEEILKNFCLKSRGLYYNLFISAAFNKKHNNLLNRYKKTIVSFLKSITNDYPIRIGTIKTSYIREVLKKEGIIFNVHRQHPNTLKASNIKLINECKEAIFIIYNNSPNISKFLEIAKEKGKRCHVLKIEKYN